MAFPFAAALRYAPAIAEAALRTLEVVKRTRSKPKPPLKDDVHGALNDLRAQVEEMEANNVKQADLVSQIAKQGDAISQTTNALVRRVNIMLLLTVGSVIVAVIALLLAVL